MSKDKQSSGVGQWLQRIGGWVTGAIGFVTGVLGFVQLAQGNSGLLTLVLLCLGIGLVMTTCFYYAVLWRPEKQDGESRLILATTTRPEKLQGQKQRRRKWVRRIAVAGLVLVPLLTLSGYGGWRYAQGLPNDEIVILVAEFDGPREEEYRVTETILTNLQAATEGYDAVRVEALGEIVTAQQGSDRARQLGEQRKASIVIWGGYGNAAVLPLSVNFEVMQPTELLPELGDTVSGGIQEVELSELETFQLQPRLSSEMNYLTLFVLGLAEYEAQDWASAATSFDKALFQIKNDPETIAKSLDSAVVLFYKGNSHFLREQFNEAIFAYDAVLKIKPDTRIVLNSKDNTLTKQGRYYKAVIAYDSALKIKSDFREALYNKGYVLDEQSQYDEAIAVYNAAVRIKPNKHGAFYNKGLSQIKIEQYQQAITTFNSALKIQPENFGSYYHLARCYALLNQTSQSLENIEKLLELAPEDGAEAIATSTEFDNLRLNPRFKALIAPK